MKRIYVHFRSHHVERLNRQTPVLVVSAHLTGDLVAKIGPKIQGALAKPFDLQEFAAKVKKLCPVRAREAT